MKLRRSNLAGEGSGQVDEQVRPEEPHRRVAVLERRHGGLPRGSCRETLAARLRLRAGLR